MANIMKLMKQAASMKKNMEKMKDDLAHQTVSFSSGGGMVTVTARGDMSIERIKLDPQVMDPEEIEMLEDLLLTAVDGALKAAKNKAAQEMSKLTADMGLPDMDLPI